MMLALLNPGAVTLGYAENNVTTCKLHTLRGDHSRGEVTFYCPPLSILNRKSLSWASETGPEPPSKHRTLMIPIYWWVSSAVSGWHTTLTHRFAEIIEFL